MADETEETTGATAGEPAEGDETPRAAADAAAGVPTSDEVEQAAEPQEVLAPKERRPRGRAAPAAPRRPPSTSRRPTAARRRPRASTWPASRRSARGSSSPIRP